MQDVQLFTEDTLEPKQERAIIELLQRPTIREAAAEVGVNESTIYRWMKEPAFASRWREARREALEHATAQLHKAASEAVATLVRVAGDMSAPASSQVAAANHILSWAYKAEHHEELNALLAELEELQEVGS